MFQNFLVKQMIKKQMKDVPPEQQDAIIAMVEKNPDFFMKIAHDVQEKMKGGMGQREALAIVMKANEEELKKITGK